MVKASVSGSKFESPQLKILGSTPRLVVFCIFLRVYFQNRHIRKEENLGKREEGRKGHGERFVERLPFMESMRALRR